MGRGLADIANREKMPYRFIDKPGMVTLQTRAGEKSPVELSAEILATLRYRAEDTFNDDLYGAVITVPAYFDEASARPPRMRRNWPASTCCA
jgi:molecular chaperone HscA